jgi:hypothetical protein
VQKTKKRERIGPIKKLVKNELQEARQQCPNSFLMESFMLGAWLIWKQRNDYIFNQRPQPLGIGNRGFFKKPPSRLIECSPTSKLIFSLLDLYR